MRKVLMVGGPRHGDMIEAETATVQLPLPERVNRVVYCPIDRLPDGQWIASWPKDVEWRPGKEIVVTVQDKSGYGAIITKRKIVKSMADTQDFHDFLRSEFHCVGVPE